MDSSYLLERQRYPLILLASLAALAAAGCAPVPRYVEPAPSAPHAMVVVSTMHLSVPGAKVETNAIIDGNVVVDSYDARPRSSALRVRPGPSAWHLGSRFFHTESRLEQERVSYTDSESDSCASRDSRGNCVSGTRSATKYRYETVTRLVDIEDGGCGEDAAYALAAGRSYRIAYVFSAVGRCEMTCLDTTDDPAGRACLIPVAPPPVAGAAGGTRPSVGPAPVRPLARTGTALIVLGTAALVAGTAAFVVADDRKSTVGKHCDSNRTCDSAGLAAAGEGKTAATVSTVSLGAGGALLVTGIAFHVLGPSKGPSARVSPTQGGAQLTVGGSF